VSTDQMTPQGLVQAGMIRLDQGRPAEALQLFDRALEAMPGDPNIQYNRLLALRGAGRMDAFRAGLTEFIKAYPNDARGYSLRGRLQADAGDFEGAVTAFDRAMQLDPDSPVYVNNKATALAALGRYEEAGRAFAAVCERNPRFQNAAFFAAASFSMANMPKESAAWARFSIDRELNTVDQFVTDPSFANLRASSYWDAAKNEPAE